MKFVMVFSGICIKLLSPKIEKGIEKIQKTRFLFTCPLPGCPGHKAPA